MPSSARSDWTETSQARPPSVWPKALGTCRFGHGGGPPVSVGRGQSLAAARCDGRGHVIPSVATGPAAGR